MKPQILRRLYLLLAISAFGCAGAQVTQQSTAAPISAGPPTAVFVYPFAANASDVSLNSGIFQVAYRNMSGEDQDAQQIQIAHQTAQNICVQVAANLTQKGITATCLQRGIPPTGNNVLILDGQFTDISEGNRLRRMVIGLGVGASKLDSVVQVIQKTDQGSTDRGDGLQHERGQRLHAGRGGDRTGGSCCRRRRCGSIDWREYRGGRRQELHLVDRLPGGQDDRSNRRAGDGILQPTRMVVLSALHPALAQSELTTDAKRRMPSAICFSGIDA
jgi:hypothetical protein